MKPALAPDIAPLRVLIVEDDPEMRRLLSAVFRSEGFNIAAADHVDSALHLLSDGFDLFMTDIRLPGRSGLELLAEIRHTHPTLPVVVMTAFGDEAAHESAAALHASQFLDKPFSIDQLRCVVRELFPAWRSL